MSINGVANPNARKRLAPCNLTSDIISNLPGNIIDSILICLPVRDAARTTVLSKKWRFKWRYIPELLLDGYFFNGSKSRKTPKEVWFQICQLLLLHCGPLRKFVLSFQFNEHDFCYVDQIIFAISGKDIQQFSLIPISTEYRLPSTLFQCAQLTHLYIHRCVFRLPPDFIGFHKLVSVNLDLNNLDVTDLKTFLSKCPLLQQLKLKVFQMHQPFEIDAPNLTFLYFSVYDSGIIIFKNVPLLSTVKFGKYARLSDHTSNAVNVFDSIPDIEHLSASHEFLMTFSAGPIPQRLPSMLNHLKSLELELYFRSLEEIQCALLLIRSAPNVQLLKIKVPYAMHVHDAMILRICAALSEVEDSLNQLKEARIENFGGSKLEVEFLKFILANSFVLNKMIIRPPKGIKKDKALELLIDVTQLERASPKAKILFSLKDA